MRESCFRNALTSLLEIGSIQVVRMLESPAAEANPASAAPISSVICELQLVSWFGVRKNILDVVADSADLEAY